MRCGEGRSRVRPGRREWSSAGTLAFFQGKEIDGGVFGVDGVVFGLDDEGGRGLLSGLDIAVRGRNFVRGVAR